VKTQGPSQTMPRQPSSVDYEAIREKHRRNGVEESEAEPSDEYKEPTHTSNDDDDDDDDADAESSASGPPVKKRAKRRGGRSHKRKANKSKSSDMPGRSAKAQQKAVTVVPAWDEDSEEDRDRRRRHPTKSIDPSAIDAAMDVEPRRTKPLPSKTNVQPTKSAESPTNDAVMDVEPRPTKRVPSNTKRGTDSDFDEAGFVASVRAAAVALISRRLEAAVESAKFRESEEEDDDDGSVPEADAGKRDGGYKRGRWSRQEMEKAEAFYAYGVKLAKGLNRPLGSFVKKSG
jgi:hypothetical protein